VCCCCEVLGPACQLNRVPGTACTAGAAVRCRPHLQAGARTWSVGRLRAGRPGGISLNQRGSQEPPSGGVARRRAAALRCTHAPYVLGRCLARRVSGACARPHREVGWWAPHPPENEGSERRRVSASADVVATARAYAPGRRAATEGAVALAGRSGPVQTQPATGGCQLGAPGALGRATRTRLFPPLSSVALGVVRSAACLRGRGWPGGSGRVWGPLLRVPEDGRVRGTGLQRPGPLAHW